MGSQSLALYQAHIETSIKTKFKSNKQTTKKTNNAGTYGYTTPEFLDGIDREEKKKRLDWLMKTDPNEFMRLSEAAAQEAPGKIENTIGKGQEKLLDDVGGIATLTGTSASVIGEKSSDAQLEADRFPKNQVIAKYQTMPPKELNYNRTPITKRKREKEKLIALRQRCGLQVELQKNYCTKVFLRKAWAGKNIWKRGK